jgi:hypothetical protein
VLPTVSAIWGNSENICSLRVLLSLTQMYGPAVRRKQSCELAFKLVIWDARDGLRHAITRVLSSAWQRCRVHLDKKRARG